MDASLPTAAFLFFSGAICYRILAGFLGLLRSTYFLENTLRISLDILFRVNDSIENSTTFKYDGLVSSGVCTEEELQKVRKLDERTLREWRNDAVKNLGNGLPGDLQRVFHCETWQDVERHYKKNKR